MERDKWEEQFKWGLTAFFVLLAVSSVVMFVTHIRVFYDALGKLVEILLPIIYGAVMAYLMAPLYDIVVRMARKGLVGLFWEMERAGRRIPWKNFKRMPFARFLAKLAGTLVSLVILVVTATGLVSMIIPELLTSISNLSESLPGLMSHAIDQAKILAQENPLAGALLGGMLEDADVLQQNIRGANFLSWLTGVQGSLSSIMNMDNGGLLGFVSSGVSYASSWIWGILVWVKNILIGLIVMVYLLNMKKGLLRQSQRLLFAVLPERWARTVVKECAFVNTVFGGFIVGKLMDSLIIGILSFLVFSIMQMPYTMLISVVVGITNVVPFFGPFVGAIPSFVLILLVDPIKSLYFLVAILVIQQLDGNVIGPKILGDSTGISSFWVLFSIVLFGGLFGFVGMLIGVPVWAVISRKAADFVTGRLKKKGMAAEASSWELPKK